MNAINRSVTTLFDWAMKPLGFLGPELALVLLSGLFGVLALLVFKQISAQKSIKATKDKIKAGLIEIRLYSYDLSVVVRAVGRVLALNAKYLFLNFGPILPLFIPFGLVAAQLVCRFGFAPMPVFDARLKELPAGAGAVLEVEMKPGSEALVDGLTVQLPAQVEGLRPLYTHRGTGKAWLEFVPRQEGTGDLVLTLADGQRVTKALSIGSPRGTPMLTPERAAPWYEAVLYPAEDSLAGTPFQKLSFVYPNRSLRYLPDGPMGVLLTFLLASMLFGALALKPLKVQI